MDSKTEGYWLELARYILVGYEEWLDSLNDKLPPPDAADADPGTV